MAWGTPVSEEHLPDEGFVEGGQRYEPRQLPLCPTCKGMARRERLQRPTPDSPEFGPWTCDLHGTLDRVEMTWLDVPVGD